MIELSLVAPGVFGKWTSCKPQGFPQPDARGLEGIIAAGERLASHRDSYRVIAALHGIEVGRDSEPPLAAVSRLGDGGRRDDNWWLRLDLVHLQIEPRSGRVAGLRALDVTQAEAAELWALLGPHFEELGWNVEPLHLARWYLGMRADPGWKTGCSAPASGGRLDLSPSPGDDSARWLAHLTEIQMLLHEAPLNRERERRGELTINALWAWGGGVLPELGQIETDTTFAADVVMAGLATLSGGRYSSDVPSDLPSLLRESPRRARVLVALEAPDEGGDDPFEWIRHVEALDRRWLRPALRGIRFGRLRRLRLWTCDGWAYQVSLPQAWLATLKREPLCKIP